MIVVIVEIVMLDYVGYYDVVVEEEIGVVGVLIYGVPVLLPTLPFTPAKFWRIRIAPMVNSVEFEI